MAPRRLAGKQFLIVEDSFLIAQEIADMLTLHGAAVLGPASSVAEALRLLQRSHPDGVLLDVKLGSETCEAVAATLRRGGIPMLLVTAMDRREIPSDLAGERYFAKPFEALDLLRAAASLLDEPSAGRRDAIGPRRQAPPEVAPPLYSVPDLVHARLQVEKAARLVAEQRAATARLSAKGLETRHARSLLRIMLNLLKQMERQQDRVAASLLQDEDGHDSALRH